MTNPDTNFVMNTFHSDFIETTVHTNFYLNFATPLAAVNQATLINITTQFICHELITAAPSPFCP